MFDTIRNATIERGGTAGTQAVFNNSAGCGPSWSLTYVYSGSTVAGDSYINNYCVTTHASPVGACTGETCTTNLFPTPTQATAAGMTESQTYGYSPVNGSSPTVGTGTNEAALCATIASAQAAAGAACLSDTTYGATYNQTDHTAVTGARLVVVRPASAAWDIGAYELGGAPAVTLSGFGGGFGNQRVVVPSATQTITVTNSGTGPLTFSTAAIGGTNASDFAATADTCTGATVTAGNTCVVTLRITPGGFGARAGTLTFTDNSVDSPQVVTLSGTGIVVAGLGFLARK